MRNLTKSLMLLLLIAIWGISAHTFAQTPQKGVVRIKLQPQVALQLGNTPRVQSNGVLSVGITPLDAASAKIGAKSIKRVFPYAPKHEAQMAKFGLDRWYEVTFDESINPMEAARIFRTTAGVQSANCKVPMVLHEGNGTFRTASAAEPVRTSEMPFNDPRLPQQWHYNNDGSLAGAKAGSDINLFEAWKTTTGKKDVVVAIIDGGVDYTHEDLSANMNVNEAEANGQPNVDDDGNGYVDDVYGYNFCTNSSEIYPHEHGTHVAGTVAAVNNNGIGVCGVAGGDGTEGSGVSMISCQVFDSRSGTAEGDFASAIVYAANRGASIAQCSWGWGSPDYVEQDVLDAIDYFVAATRSDKLTGGIMFFATGNNGDTGNYYPGCYDKVVAVGSMANDFTVTSYSNYGSWVDIVAPGGLLDYGDQGGVLSTLPDNSYGYNEGTSMATPHVSGIAALVLSQHGNANMLNETLRQQIITSVNDLYSYNPGTEGMHGNGYIDAAKALQMGDGTAPEAVTSFTALPAQDNVTLQWTIPASGDNNVNYHIIYYSTEPFDATTDLNTLSRAVADTKFLASGDEFTYELTGLKSLTTYYIAIKAVNRWGNASELSPVVTTTTNAGPKMTISKTYLSMAVDANNSNVASATFNIGNEDEGLLKWNGFARTTQYTISTRSTKPQPGIVTPFSGKLAVMPHAANEKFSTADYNVTDYPVNFQYYDNYYASIGESDTSLPNSQAQWFYVDKTAYPEGFNLTAVKIQTTYGQNPTIQIYKGNNLASASKLCEMTPYFYSEGDMRLSEQFFFAPGESFWVVAHFPAQESSPYTLGMATAIDEAYSAYSYMSNDMGKTWVTLKNALIGSPYESLSNPTWAITAISHNPDWSTLLVLDPAEGTVKQGETQTVTISNDGQPLVNGTYKFNVRFNTNESEANSLTLPITLTVKNNKPQMATAKVVNFGDLLVGESKTITVEVVNEGYGVFGYYGSLGGNRIACNSEHFQVPTYIAGGFPARSAKTFDVTFAPKSSGSHTGTITFKNSDNTEFKVTVYGTATDPANIEVNPDTIEIETLDVDVPTTTTAQFTIANTGNYPLEYVFPKYSDEKLDSQTKTAHKYGYSAETNLNGATGFAYDGKPELLGGTDITASFSDDVYLSKEIALGFNFPFYGKSYDKVYVTSFGGIAFNTGESVYRSPLTETSYGLDGVAYISAYGYQLALGPNSKIEYAKQDGKFFVNFKDVMALVYDQEYTPVSFRIALASNGDIEVYYDSYDAMALFQEGSTLYCGIHDPEDADPLTVTSADIADYWGSNDDPAGDVYNYFTSQTAVKFVAPKANFITNIAPAYGIVNPGESTTVTASIAANENLVAGATYNRVTLLSNDPDQSTTHVRFNTVVTGESLKPVATLENEALDFGQVFRTSVSQLPVTVKNNGKDSLEVTAVAVANGNVEVNISVPFKLAPGMSKDIIVTLPTVNEGAVEDIITITTNAGELVANVKGEVIGVPTLDLSYTEITETVESGTELKKPLTITNNGNEPLVYSIAPNSLIEFTEAIDENSKTSYTYSASVDGNGVEYNWIDIETTGLGEQNNFSYYNSHDFVEVELPFEFPFYGKKYSKMYIYNTGFVSFTERADQKMWPEPPAQFPNGTIYTNIIAPYWGMHTMDISKTAGTYHYITEDEAIVSFMEYGNTMNMGVCYQLIMKKDGTFKYQYKGYGDYAIIYGAFGLAGISNEDATESIKLPERYIAFGNAVQFSPVVEQTVAAGESKTIDIDVITDKMAGNYTGNIEISSNVPASEKVMIPVDLTITGEAKPVFPDSIVVERVAGHFDDPSAGPITQMGANYEAYFTIKNEGTAPFTITHIKNGGPSYYDEWFGTYNPMFMVYYEADETDWMTGEPTGNRVWTQYYDYTPFTVGATPQGISVPMMYDIASQIGTYEIPLTFYYNESDSAVVKVKFIVTDIPYAVLDKEEIRVENVADDYEGVETVTLSNMGNYKLTYELRMDPSGIGEVVSDGNTGGGGVMPAEKTQTVKTLSAEPLSKEAQNELSKNIFMSMSTMATSTNVIDAPQDFEHTNALFYPTMEGSSTPAYGTGNKYGVYKAATAYQAPEEGFNISHIYIATTLTNMDGTSIENADITVEIVNGDDYENGDVLSTGKVHFDSMEGAKFVIVPLDRAVYMSPGQNFYVRVTYPAGVEYPAYMSSKEEAVVSNRYMGYVEGYGWFDVASMFKETYGSLGYIMTCLETTKGDAWAKLENEQTSGEVAPGESVTLKVRLNAAAAPKEKDNKAVIVIKSNDVYNSVINFPVYLSKNGAPVITAPTSMVYTKEADTTVVNITVAEPEGDDMTIALTDANEMVTISSVTADNVEAQITVNDDNTISVAGSTSLVNIEVAIAPEYETAGTYSFGINATDNANHTGKATVRYYVEHSNRAPEAVEYEGVTVELNSTSDVLTLSDLFSDPDGDEMTYAITLSAEGIATMFVSGNDVIFMGKTLGTVVATVTATDANGAQTQLTFNVEVTSAVGIGNVTVDSKVTVYPNPVVETLYVTCDFNSDAVTYAIYDYSGKQAYIATDAVTAGCSKAINVSNFSEGIYILKVATADGTAVHRFVKK